MCLTSTTTDATVPTLRLKKQKAKSVLWESYCDEYDPEVRAKYLDEDLKTLEDGYIIDYGYIDETILVEE